MELKLHTGMRVLYKYKNQWDVGILVETGTTKLTEKGLYVSVVPSQFIHMNYEDVPYFHDAEINDLFLDAGLVEEWMKEYNDIFMTKEDYVKFIKSDDFVKASERSFVSDGEYYYYPISRYNQAWIMKQPFPYVVRMT